MNSLDIDWNWVDDHMKDDPASLSLKYGADMRDEIVQIDCRRRTAKKLSQTLGTPCFIFPSVLASQQCSSDAMARFHASLVSDGETVLDMTAGLSVDDFHIACKASHVTAIDIRQENICAAAHNARLLNIGNIEFIVADSVTWLENTDRTFDVIFIDPSRRDENNRRCYSFSDCSPDISQSLQLFKQKARKLIIKASPMLDISAVTRQIPGISRIYVLGNEKECKELLAVIDFYNPHPFRLYSVTVTDEKVDILEIPDVNKSQEITYADPKEGGFIYLPYPSIMKVDCIPFLSGMLGLSPVAANTHLLVSDILRSDFPGNTFRIIQIFRYDKKTIKSFRALYPSINITSRNFPCSASRLVSVLKIKEGGKLRLFAISLADCSNILVVAEPV